MTSSGAQTGGSDTAKFEERVKKLHLGSNQSQILCGWILDDKASQQVKDPKLVVEGMRRYAVTQRAMAEQAKK